MPSTIPLTGLQPANSLSSRIVKLREASVKRDDKRDFTIATQMERAYAVGSFGAKSLASLLPVGGGILAASFDLIVADPAKRRRDVFFNEVDARLTALEQQGRIKIEEIADNDDISSFLLHSMQVASRAAGEAKIEALKNVVVNGLLSAKRQGISPVQIVLNYLDRMTDYHIVLLRWEAGAKQFYPVGQIDAGVAGARESLFYGQPVFEDPNVLSDPEAIDIISVGKKIYAERADVLSFKLARTELVSMGLLVPVYQQESYAEGRVLKNRTTNTIVGHDVSSLGNTVLSFFCVDEA